MNIVPKHLFALKMKILTYQFPPKNFLAIALLRENRVHRIKTLEQRNIIERIHPENSPKTEELQSLGIGRKLHSKKLVLKTQVFPPETNDALLS